MYNLHSNISQSLKFNILILLSLFGCYPVSHIIIGEVKSPINVADVKVYFDFPKNCEKIAIIEASSNFALKDPSFDFTHQNKTDKALSRLKEEAASMGANGLVVNDLSTKKLQAIKSVAMRMGNCTPHTALTTSKKSKQLQFMFIELMT